MDETTEWTTEEMRKEFNVVGFALGVCVVKRKSDGVTGTLDFERRGEQRIYFGWQVA
jgi:hypothetical protein